MTVFPLLGQLSRDELRVASLGGKGAWLHWLVHEGVGVPAGFVLPVRSLESLPESSVARALEGALEQLRKSPGATGALAVRASPVTSQPGVLPTVLGVRGVDDVMEALRALHQAARAAGVPCAAVIQHEVAAGPDGFAAAAFTREPSRGSPGVVGEWSAGGPGSDVVGGRRQLPALSRGANSLRARRPGDFEEIRDLAARLEQASGRILELELLHDGARLWAVQARPVPRHALAAVRLAVERLSTDAAAWIDLHPSDTTSLWVEQVASGQPLLARGLAASPGIAVGAAVGCPLEVERRGTAGEPVLLVRPHALPQDVPAMRVATGVLTSAGGITCHAAVMARGLGKPAVVSCEGLEVREGEVRLHGRTLSPDELLSVDGGVGSVYAGKVPCVRLPGGQGVPRLLELLAARRRVPLWVRTAEGVDQDAVGRLSADGCLEGDPPAEGSAWSLPSAPPAGSLPAFEPGGAVAVDAAHFLAWAVALDAGAAPNDPGLDG